MPPRVMERDATPIPDGEHPVAELDRRAEEVVDRLLNEATTQAAMEEQTEAIAHFGGEVIRAAADATHRGPLRSGSRTALDEEVGSTLQRLQEQLKALDPGGRRGLGVQRKLFGLIPLGNGLGRYFQEYRSAQRELNQTLQSLYRGADALRRDVAQADRERPRLLEAIRHLQQYIHLGASMDRLLEAALKGMDQTNPHRAATLREGFLFTLRQRTIALNSQLAVTSQSAMALDLIRRNHLELIQGIERTSTTTLSALRTAVRAAEALTHQPLILDRIQQTTRQADASLATAAEALRDQAPRSADQEARLRLELDHLKSAYADIYSVIHSVQKNRSEQRHKLLRITTGSPG